MCVRTVLSTFFLHASGHPRYLHSFPTRRSSDLRAARQRQDRGRFLATVVVTVGAGAGRHGGRRFRTVVIRPTAANGPREDRKSTRLNSSHRCISYAVFCLKKKKQKRTRDRQREG